MSIVFKPPSAEVIIEVPFHDVDPAHIVWHGHYIKYLEVARCKLLDTFDYNYNQMCESGYFWPVIDLHIRYPQAARFGQKLCVKATLREWENRLTIDYTITDANTHKRLTKAKTVQVAVCMESKEMQIASPQILFDKLGLDR